MMSLVSWRSSEFSIAASSCSDRFRFNRRRWLHTQMGMMFRPHLPHTFVPCKVALKHKVLSTSKSTSMWGHGSGTKPQEARGSASAVSQRIHDTNKTTIEVPVERLDGPEQDALSGVSKFLERRFEVSAYDTAWVGRIPAHRESPSESEPHFPRAVNWIMQNQHADGSWGQPASLSKFEQVLSTLACLLTASESSLARGVHYLERNLNELNITDLVGISEGGKHAFVALLEQAREMGLCLPVSNPIIDSWCTEHTELLKRLRNVDVLQECSCKLLAFPEALHKVIDWNKADKLQSANGSLFSSPAATACFIIKSGNHKAIEYVSSGVLASVDAVPRAYPVEILEVLGMVEHLERLNIDHYFHYEISSLLDSLSRDKDVGKYDLETRAAIFLALRRHGYEAESTTYFFKATSNSQEDTLGVEGLLHVYRASELMFPDDTLLEHLKEGTAATLKSLMGHGNIKNRSLNAHVEEVMSFPSFLRHITLDSTNYIERFEKETALYPETNFSRFMHWYNPALLNLSKKVFNTRQSVYQNELASLMSWYKDSSLAELEGARKSVSSCFLTAAASMPDVQLEYARRVWTYGAVLTTEIDDLFDEHGSLEELQMFAHCVREWDLAFVSGCSESVRICASALFSNIEELVQQSHVFQGRSMESFFKLVWRNVIDTFLVEAEWSAASYEPSLEEYFNVADISFALEPITLFAAVFRGELYSEADLEQEEFWKVSGNINRLGRILNDRATHSREKLKGKTTSISIYARENPGVSEEAALHAIAEIQSECAKSLLSRLLSPYSEVPKTMRATLISMTKTLYLMYYSGDGYRYMTEELRNTMKRFLTHPFVI